LLLPDVEKDAVRAVIDWENSRLDVLVDESLTERWRQNHHAGVPVLREAVNAVVVVFVVHPVVEPLLLE